MYEKPIIADVTIIESTTILLLFFFKTTDEKEQLCKCQSIINYLMPSKANVRFTRGHPHQGFSDPPPPSLAVFPKPLPLYLQGSPINNYIN